MSNDTQSTRYDDAKSNLAWLVATIIICRLISSFVLPVYDDAFITYRYARNLAAIGQFVYNPNDWVLGVTCPAFGLICAAIYKLGAHLPSVMPLVNTVIDGVILLILFRCLCTSTGSVAAILFGALFAAEPIVARVCVGGMESDLFLLGSLAAVGLYANKNAGAASLLAGLLYFLRPEGALLMLLICALELRARGLKNALLCAGISLLVIAPGLFLIFHTYGHLLPQSVIAKGRAVNGSLLNVVKTLIVPSPEFFALVPLAIWGYVKRGRGNEFLRLFGLWVGLYASAYLLARPAAWSWYGEPIFVGILCFAALGFDEIISHTRLAARVRLVTVLAVLLPVLLWAGVVARNGRSAVERNVYMPMTAWCETNTNTSTTIVAGDIGAIGYYSNAKIYDAAGLVWPSALSYSTMGELIQDRRPDFVMITATREDFLTMAQWGGVGNYSPVARFSKDGSAELKPNPESLSQQWIQDYIVYRKKP